MAIRSSFEIFRLVKNGFSHLKALFYRINLQNLCLIGKFMVQGKKMISAVFLQISLA